MYLQTLAALVCLALAPLLPGAETLLGDLRVQESLLALVPAALLWTANFWVFRSVGPDHWWFRSTYFLELFCLHAFTLALIFGSGSAASVVWVAAPMSALYWASLRPHAIWQNLAVATTAHLALCAAFLSVGQPFDAMFSLFAALIFAALYTVAARSQTRVMVVEARRNLADRQLRSLQFAGMRQRMEQNLDQQVGAQLSELADELQGFEANSAAAVRGGSRVGDYAAQAREALQELKRAVTQLRVEEPACSLQTLCEEIERKCSGLLPTGYRQTAEANQLAETISGETAFALLRVAQELTRNAVVHGKASAVHLDVSLQLNDLIMSVHDDGVGLSTTAWESSEGGLRNAKVWAKELGGTVEHHVEPSGVGTKLVVRVPRQLLKPRS